jgi:hypothetical protein
MKLKVLGANQTQVTTADRILFFSYETPVAMFDNTSASYFRTEKRYSTTTESHINHWLNGMDAEKLPQSVFDNL